MHEGEEGHAQPGWTTSRRGQDSPWKSQLERQRTGINGESTSMVWPTLGSRTAKEQNRTVLCVDIQSVLLSQSNYCWHTHLTDCCAWTTNVSNCSGGFRSYHWETEVLERSPVVELCMVAICWQSPRKLTHDIFLKITIASIVSRDHCVNLDRCVGISCTEASNHEQAYLQVR